MKRLRKRSRYDTLKTEVRVRKGSIGRWVYLCLLAALFYWLLDVFIGPTLFFRAEGLVTQERRVVAAPFTAKVQELSVEDADRVLAEQIVAIIKSPEMEESIARLSMQLADLKIREAQLNTRTEVLKAVLPVANDRAREISALRKTSEDLLRQQLVTAYRHSDTLDDAFEGVFDRERLTAELRSSSTEMEKLATALRQATDTLNTVKDTYAEGIVRSPVDGLVSNLAVAPGSVVPVGEPLMEIFTGPRHVLAYATPGALEQITVGESVTLSYGVERLHGTIAKVLPISDKLPLEFQRSFRPRERGQVIRIDLDPAQTDKPLPLFTKVKIHKSRRFLEPIKNWLASL